MLLDDFVCSIEFHRYIHIYKHGSHTNTCLIGYLGAIQYVDAHGHSVCTARTFLEGKDAAFKFDTFAITVFFLYI